uniref:Retrovirus-related Pol polyprotein from transposon TNT 1-94 n=1 Tax=Tanacetum cinerariifolium TaxID=118510 RepID=A0A6L2M0W4_TANCI|nr:hypothetical protein [Tanacetum cinerariifolium]
MCHIIGIEPQFENIIKNGPFIPMAIGKRKPEGQSTEDERQAANLNQRLKSLIMFVLLDDQMNSVTNCLTAKSTWDDLIIYHEDPSNMKESRVMDLNLDDEEDTRSSQEYMNDLEEEYQTRALLAKSKRFFKKGTQRFSGAKATDQTEYNKCAPLLSLEKLAGAKPIPGPKTIKSNLKSNPTFKAETLKDFSESHWSSKSSLRSSPSRPVLSFPSYIHYGYKDHQSDDCVYYPKLKTPMVPPNKLGPDLNGKAINETQYRAIPKESQLIAVKRIFRYLKGTPNLGLWYPKCLGFDLKGYSDFDYARCNMDRKSTSGAYQLLGVQHNITSPEPSPVFTSITRYGETIPAKGTLKKSLLPPSLANGINIDYASIFWEGIIIKLNMKHREKFVPYTRFLSLLIMHKMKEGCGDGYDALVDSTAEADLTLSAPNDFIPQQQGMDEGTKNTLFDHISIGTDPHVLTDQTKSVSKGLETVLTQPLTRKRASSIARQVEEEEAFRKIKLEDLAKLVLNMQRSFKDLDSPEDNLVIVVDDSDDDEEDEITLLQMMKLKTLQLLNPHLPAEAEADLLKAQPSFPNVVQLNELLVALVQAKLKSLDALLSLLLKVTKALNKFAQVLDSASSKAGDQIVPSVGLADTMPAEGEKNTNQATIS